MKNTKTKIILSAIIFLSVIGFIGTVTAANSSLYVSPASITKTSGNIFNVSVGVNASGNKVCAVEGTLLFSNLFCQSITLASDVMVQTSPTCANPYFFIGVPNCTVSDKALMTMSVKAGNAGVASIVTTGVDIIGEGASVGSTSINGSYTVNAVSVEPKKIKTVQPEETTQEVVESQKEVVQIVETPAQETTIESSLPSNDLQASLVTTGFNFNNYIWIGLIIIIIVGFGYYFIRKGKK